MDHFEAKHLNAAEKYVLGELTPELRDDYEKHYFDCADCSEDVRAAATFVTASKQIFQQDPVARPVAAPVRVPEKVSGFSAWFAWLRPAIAVPVMAALVAVIVYQNVASTPGARNSAAPREAQAFASSFRLQGSVRGNNEPTKIAVGANEPFALDFDFTPSQTFPNYEARVLDASGKTIFAAPLPSDLTNREVHLAIAGGTLRPGAYDLLVVAKNDGSSPSNNAVEVQRLHFAIEFRP
jgi:anti-sigma factor RsiW